MCHANDFILNAFANNKNNAGSRCVLLACIVFMYPAGIWAGRNIEYTTRMTLLAGVRKGQRISLNKMHPSLFLPQQMQKIAGKDLLQIVFGKPQGKQRFLFRLHLPHGVIAAKEHPICTVKIDQFPGALFA